MFRQHQLWTLSGPEFEVFGSWSPTQGRKSVRVGSIPFLHWPNGRWCLEGNLFLNSLLERRLSTRGRGGTLGTYAAYLSPLIRYCALYGKDFIDLNDGDFVESVIALYSEERRKKGVVVQAYNATTVRNMVGVWLSFLEFVGRFHGAPDFVSPGGRIDATRESSPVRVGDRVYVTETWTHKALREGDAVHRRLPMSERTLRALRTAAATSGKGGFRRLRRLVMLELFDVTGMRRMEASLLTAKAVSNAVRDYESKLAKAALKVTSGTCGDYSPAVSERDATFLVFDTVKGGLTRHVPVSPSTLAFFDSYLRRRRALLKRLGLDPDRPDSPFFVNLRTGESMTPNTFTLEFSILAKEAGISKEPCSPHLLRHRYIVRCFVRLLLAHQMECQDDFRRALLDSTAFKEKVRQVTGHVSVDSLDVYINLAFEEIAQLAQTMDRVQMQAHLDSALSAVERYRDDLAGGHDLAGAAEDLAKAVEALRVVKVRAPT